MAVRAKACVGSSWNNQPPGADCIRKIVMVDVPSAGARSVPRCDGPLRIFLSLLIAAGLSACGRADRSVTVSAVARDIALAAETTVVSARVASGATLASMLREQDVTPQEAAEMIARSGGGVRSAEGARRAALPFRMGDRTGPAAARLRNRRRSIACASAARGQAMAGRRSAADSQDAAASRSCAGRSIASTPSLVAAMDAAGETIDLTLALAEIFGGDIDFNTELQPGDQLRADGRETVSRRPAVCWLRSDSRRGVHQRGPADPRRAVRRRRRHARLLRRARRLDASVLPRLAAEVSAGGDVGLLAQPFSSDPARVSRAPRRRLPRAGRRAGRRGVPTGWSSRREPVAVQGGWCTCATRTASKPSICIFRRSPCIPARTSTRATSSGASARPAWRPVRTSTTV